MPGLGQGVEVRRAHPRPGGGELLGASINVIIIMIIVTITTTVILVTIIVMIIAASGLRGRRPSLPSAMVSRLITLSIPKIINMVFM